MAKMRVQAPCPACRKDGVSLETVTHQVAHFGEVIESVLRCERCGFRTSSTLIADQREGMRHELAVDGEAALSARVVRSTSCTVRVPELGVKIEPAMASDAYITNVEGLLVRIEQVLMHVRASGDEQQQDKAVELLDKLGRMVDGEEAFTVILDDPLGNSAIVHEAVERRRLTADELEELPTGMRVLEGGDVAP